MSISHWGFFPGFWQVGEPIVPRMGMWQAVWAPCDIEAMVQWS